MSIRKFTLPPNNTFITPQVFPNHFQDVYNMTFPSSSIPSKFDSRTNWPFMKEAWDSGMMGPFNQGQCGSCWAFATTSCLQWKVSIHSGIPIPRLSQQYLVDSQTTIPLQSRVACVGQSFIAQSPDLKKLVNENVNWEMNGCNGSSTLAPVCFTVENFIPFNEDYPYISEDGVTVGPIPPPVSPENGVKAVLARGVSLVEGGTSNAPSDSIRMQQALVIGGPIVAAFVVYESFMKYWTCGYMKNSSKEDRFVYKSDTTTSVDGGHAVLVIGWGETSKGTKYWIVLNSWDKWDSSLLQSNPCTGFDPDLHKGSPVDEGLFYIQFNDSSGFENQCTTMYVDNTQAKCFAKNLSLEDKQDCSKIIPASPPIGKYIENALQSLKRENFDSKLVTIKTDIVISYHDMRIIIIVIIILFIILLVLLQKIK